MPRKAKSRNPNTLLSRYPLLDETDLDKPSPLDDLFGGSIAAERVLRLVRGFLSSRRRATEDDDPAVLLPLLDEVDTLSAALHQQLQAQTTPRDNEPTP